MVTALLTIAAIICAVGGLLLLLYTMYDDVVVIWDWALNVVEIAKSVLPDWLLPWVAVTVILALVGLIVKLL